MITPEQIKRALDEYFKEASYIDFTDDPSDVEYQQFANNFADCINEVLKEDENK